jgi:hypothetical protein
MVVMMPYSVAIDSTGIYVVGDDYTTRGGVDIREMENRKKKFK